MPFLPCVFITITDILRVQRKRAEMSCNEQGQSPTSTASGHWHRFGRLWLTASLLLTVGCTCRLPGGPAIVHDWSIDANSNVTNGTAFDVGTVPVMQGATLFVPTGTTVVIRDDVDARVVVHLIKDLKYYGHPSKGISPATARRKMGCAWRKRGGVVELATYGEWTSIEGGASLSILACVPRNILVRFGDDLSGMKSKAAGERSFAAEWRGDSEYWGTAGTPQPGWTIVATEPDHEGAKLAGAFAGERRGICHP